MKRGVTILLFILSLALGGLLYYYSSNKETSDEYYTIRENKSYVIDDDRELSFSIYSKEGESLISEVSRNLYTLSLNDIKTTLENVRVSSLKLDEDMYLYKVYASVPSLTDSEIGGEASLNISNNKYSLTLDIGYLSLLNPKDYKLLSVDALSISDSYINKRLYAVGLNIKLSKEHQGMRDLKIGSNITSRPDLALENQNFKNQVSIKGIIPGYSPLEEKPGSLRLKSDTLYFIPLTYKELLPLREGYISVVIDGIKYYLDTFSFKTNELDYKEYILKEGIIEHARG